MGCKKCMFSFGQKSMHNVIGNNQLTVDKYSKIKEYLLEDIRNTLKAKHNAPSLIDIMERSHNE